MSSLGLSTHLGRTIRQGPAADLGRPTSELLFEALAADDTAAAAETLDYLFQERFIIRDLNSVFVWHLVHYVLERTDLTWAELLEESIAPWVSATLGNAGADAATVELGSGRTRLATAGTRWQVHVSEGDKRYHLSLGPPEEQLARWTQRKQQLIAAIGNRDRGTLDAALAEQSHEELVVHDIYGDWAWALLSLAARRWGEACLGDMLRVTQDPWLTPRYAAAAQMNAAQALELAVEGMRGHFAGPGRQGEVSVVEEPSRYVMSFDACGSGGRMRRGDTVTGTGSRLDAPYHFLNVTEAYDFTWNRRGVCAYCAHCAVALQLVPIERIGHPIRVTEYPDDAREPCRWIIYKQPELIPAHAYTEVGKEPPQRLAETRSVRG